MINFLGTVNSKTYQQGASMIEVMITVFVVAVGLLGVAGLQSVGLKQASDSHTDAQAQILAQDLAEMILAYDSAAKGDYAMSSVPASKGKECLTTSCTNAELAQYNVWTWRQNMEPVLPSFDLDINFVSATRSYDIVLTWDANRDGAAYSAASCAPDDNFKAGCFAMLLTLTN
jgi:type IV pilus assembly protein PilV